MTAPIRLPVPMSKAIAKTLKRLEKRLKKVAWSKDDLWEANWDYQDLVSDLYPYLQASDARRFRSK